MTDVIIIGAGVSGSAAARELSKYKLSVMVLEKEEDVCCETSKANSGIVHAGYDARPGSLMAELNVMGNEMMGELSKKLDFPFIRNGSLVVSFEEKSGELARLYDQGVKNGVKGLRILNGEEAGKMEPNLSGDVKAALFAPSAGIVCPFGMNIAFAENAAVNGAEFRFCTKVENIVKEEQSYRIETNNGVFQSKYVVNAAGVYADEIHNMVSQKKLHITPRRGEYILLDRSAGGFVSHVIFQEPSKYGKGVLVTPTAHGNILAGPTAFDLNEKEAVNTTAEGLSQIVEKSLRSLPNLPLHQVITSFAGLRAHEDGHEFIIEENPEAPGFIDCAGIESPGLTSAPAIGVRVAKIITDRMHPSKKPDFIDTRTGILDPKKLSAKDRNRLIKIKPEYGNIVCRCEMVSEGEILDAIHRPLGAKTLDGVKRRTRAGMGRCQSGFCAPKTMEILSREWKVPFDAITKAGAESKMITGRVKENVEVSE